MKGERVNPILVCLPLPEAKYCILEDEKHVDFSLQKQECNYKNIYRSFLARESQVILILLEFVAYIRNCRKCHVCSNKRFIKVKM